MYLLKQMHPNQMLEIEHWRMGFLNYSEKNIYVIHLLTSFILMQNLKEKCNYFKLMHYINGFDLFKGKKKTFKREDFSNRSVTNSFPTIVGTFEGLGLLCRTMPWRRNAFLHVGVIWSIKVYTYI